MQTLSRSNGLRPLTAYEPFGHRRAGGIIELSRAGRQLELDLPIFAPGKATEHGRQRADRSVPSLERRHLRSLLIAILEVREGRRAPTQLQSVLHPRLYQRFLDATRTVGTRYALKSVHACEPAAGVVEACGTVRAGGRALAVAARFERSRRGWRCTSFELLGARSG